MQNRLGLNPKTGYTSYAKAKGGQFHKLPYKGLAKAKIGETLTIRQNGKETKYTVCPPLPGQNQKWTLESPEGHKLTDRELNGLISSGAEVKMALPDSDREKFQNFRKSERKVVQGTDIAESYEGPTDIRSVLKAQGFEGPPKLMKKADFDKAVQASSFIAQRSYSASSQEVLDAYTDMLHNGYWYVECTTGGAQYGQGMYCAANYSGFLSPGITEEMDHYDAQYDQQLGTPKTKDEWLSDAAEALNNKGYSDEDCMEYAGAYFDQSGMDKFSLPNQEEVWEVLEQVPRNKPCLHRHETITLDPSAKIITADMLYNLSKGNVDDDGLIEDFSGCVPYIEEQCKAVGEQYGADAQYWIEDCWNVGGPYAHNYMQAQYKFAALSKETQQALIAKTNEMGETVRSLQEKAKERLAKYKDISKKYSDWGSLAAALGYDAINAEGHGQSGSYTVILNRTKCIFLDDSEGGE